MTERWQKKNLFLFTCLFTFSTSVEVTVACRLSTNIAGVTMATDSWNMCSALSKRVANSEPASRVIHSTSSNQTAYCHFQNGQPLDPIMSQFNPLHVFKHYFFKLDFNITLLSCPFNSFFPTKMVRALQKFYKLPLLLKFNYVNYDWQTKQRLFPKTTTTN